MYTVVTTDILSHVKRCLCRHVLLVYKVWAATRAYNDVSMSRCIVCLISVHLCCVDHALPKLKGYVYKYRTNYGIICGKWFVVHNNLNNGWGFVVYRNHKYPRIEQRTEPCYVKVHVLPFTAFSSFGQVLSFSLQPIHSDSHVTSRYYFDYFLRWVEILIVE